MPIIKINNQKYKIPVDVAGLIEGLQLSDDALQYAIKRLNGMANGKGFMIPRIAAKVALREIEKIRYPIIESAK